MLLFAVLQEQVAVRERVVAPLQEQGQPPGVAHLPVEQLAQGQVEAGLHRSAVVQELALAREQVLVLRRAELQVVRQEPLRL